jgi:hypothetical protein
MKKMIKFIMIPVLSSQKPLITNSDEINIFVQLVTQTNAQMGLTRIFLSAITTFLKASPGSAVL